MKEPELPEEASKLAVDFYYGARDFPEDAELHSECNCSGCEDCIRGVRMNGTRAEIYENTGDVRCPHCQLVHMTPANMEVKPGVLNCQNCGNVSIVTQEVAEKCANPGWRAA